MLPTHPLLPSTGEALGFFNYHIKRVVMTASVPCSMICMLSATIRSPWQAFPKVGGWNNMHRSKPEALSTPLTGGSWDPAGLPESGRWLEGKRTASRSGMAENWTWGDEAGGGKGKARSLWMEPPESQNPSHLRLDYGGLPWWSGG